jgi:adenosine deaminase
MPKAELHIHLEGAIKPETVLTLAKRHKILDSLPTTDLEELKSWFTFTNFEHFINVYTTIQDLIRTEDDFALIAYECGADMATQNIRYREVTVTPFVHTNYQQKNLAITSILQGLEAGRQQAKSEFGVEIRWVFDIPRNLSFPKRDGTTYDPYPANQTLEYALQGQSFGVVGLGLGGYEKGAPASPFAHAFQKAKEQGLYSLPHAGETAGPKSVWSALNDLSADRIGHGVRSIEDDKLVLHLIEHQIPLEVNPTSNICLKIYSDLDAHPFNMLYQAGLYLTVNSDDPPLFNTNLLSEYHILVKHFDFNTGDLIRIAQNAFVASAAETGLKEQLLSEFDNWTQTWLIEHSPMEI